MMGAVHLRAALAALVACCVVASAGHAAERPASALARAGRIECEKGRRAESRDERAQTCEARGEREEALAFARRALQVARAQGRADKVAEAQATLAELGAASVASPR